MLVILEVFSAGAWHHAGQLEAAGEDDVPRGYQGRSHFDYDFDYASAVENINAVGYRALSCAYPVDFNVHALSHWPAFVLDILPAGAARRAALRQANLDDNRRADWPLLQGAAAPPGNVRVRPVRPLVETTHPGFTYEEVVGGRENFIEYAREHGAPVAGSTGAQGDAPKFMLTQDASGRWHADGALPDARATRHWIVKFPRGRAAADLTVLRNEAAYMAVAKRVGLRVAELPNFDAHALFVPRFDREVTSSGVVRLGQESLCSLAGVAEYGVSLTHQRLCQTIATHCTDFAGEILEYVKRDVFNVAMGNTDNHARNTAVSKYMDGSVRLSPLYDFAPMVLDPEGIARVCRWENCEVGGQPDWGHVAESLGACGIDSNDARKQLSALAPHVERLCETMLNANVETGVIKRMEDRIAAVTRSLKDARPRRGKK